MKRRSPTPVADWKLEQGTPIWPAQSDSISEERAQQVRDALDRVGERSVNDLPYQAVIEMRVWGKYTFQEIAELLSLNGRQNAHDLYVRGIRWLREELQDEEAE